jgi:hypothetical protein
VVQLLHVKVLPYVHEISLMTGFKHVQSMFRRTIFMLSVEYM